MKKISALLVGLLLLANLSCKKEKNNLDASDSGLIENSASKTATVLLENFENGTKTAYTAGDVTLSSGVWNFNDALLGNSAADIKNGLQSTRVRNSGKLTMKFDAAAGASTITVYHAKY